MTVEEAVAITEAVKTDFSQKNDVARGLAILAKYGDGLEVAAEHDEIYAGQGDIVEFVAKMSEADVRELAGLGWRLHQEFECWCKFV